MIRITEEQGRWLTTFFEALRQQGTVPAAGSRSEAHLQLLETTITEQAAAPSHAADLVDKIAAILLDPSIRELGHGSLAQLRAAVLSPKELASVTSRLERPISCRDCGNSIGEEEVCSRLGQYIYCYRCCPPLRVRCSKCEDGVDISQIHRTIERAVERHTCREAAAPTRRPASPSLSALQRAARGITSSLYTIRPNSIQPAVQWVVAPPPADEDILDEDLDDGQS